MCMCCVCTYISIQVYTSISDTTGYLRSTLPLKVHRPEIGSRIYSEVDFRQRGHTMHCAAVSRDTASNSICRVYIA